MKPNSHTSNGFAILLSVTLLVCGAACTETREEQQLQARAKQGNALFEERCKTVAGEKIYKTVENVDGILLLRVRPHATDRNLSDPNWPGAAFAREREEDGYITSFLAYEHSGSPDRKPVTPDARGFITTDYQPDNPSNLPGYRYVDVIDTKDGKRYRHMGRWEEPWKYDKSYLKGYIKFFLDRQPAPDPAPRYGVTFEDNVIPEERALGLASSTVKVVDLKTNEVLGEMTRYAWTLAKPNPANPVPWLSAYRCKGYAVGADTVTRLFVDQILKIRKDQ